MYKTIWFICSEESHYPHNTEVITCLLEAEPNQPSSLAYMSGDNELGGASITAENKTVQVYK